MPPPARKPPRACNCCVVMGAQDDHTAVRICPHCLSRKGDTYDMPDAGLLERQVAQSREAHDRLCTKTQRGPAPFRKGWKR